MHDGHTRNHTREAISTSKQFNDAKEKYNFRICRLPLKILSKIVKIRGHDTHKKTLEYLQVLGLNEYSIHESDNIILSNMLSKYELANDNWTDIISINYVDGRYYCHPGTSRLSFFEFYPDRMVDVMLWGEQCDLDKYNITIPYIQRPFELIHQEMYQHKHERYVENLQFIFMYDLDYFRKYKTCKITPTGIYLDKQMIYKLIDRRWHIKSKSGWFSFDETA